MYRHIKNLAHALAVTTLFCVATGGTILLVQHVEAHGVTRLAARFLSTRAAASAITTQRFKNRAIQPALIELVDSLRPGDTVSLCAYAFTDPVLAELLREKSRDGVYIQIVADTSGITHEASQITGLADDIPVYCWPSPHHTFDGKPPLQHNKLWVIKRGGVWIVITGSYNLTRSAAQSNNENILVITGNRELAQHYQADFDELKAESVLLHDILPKKRQKQLKKLDDRMRELITGVAP